MQESDDKGHKTPASEPAEAEISSSSPSEATIGAELDERDAQTGQKIALPAHVASSGSLDRLVDQARGYAASATAENTAKAYRADWKHFASWCRRKGADPLVPSPAVVGLYITDCAKPADGRPALAVSTIERRLAGLSANYRARGLSLDTTDRHIAEVWAGIKRTHGKQPEQKEAVLIEDVLAMVGALSHSLRDMRDRAILLVGYAGGLRRTEIVGLDVGKDETEDGRGWVEILKDGAVLRIKGKTGWREVEIGRGSQDATCPVHALEEWLHFGKIDFGPVFRRVYRENAGVGTERLSDKHVVRLIKRLVLEAGVGRDRPALSKLSDAKRANFFAGHSLRAGLASSAEVDERYVQKQLGHASAEMTRKYQRRRDRFRVNLTKAAGL